MNLRSQTVNGTGRESLDIKWKKSTCYTPPFKAKSSCLSQYTFPNTHNITSLWLIWKPYAFLILIYMLSYFAKDSKHINRRNKVQHILVRSGPLHVQNNVIADNSEPWYLPPFLAPYCFLDSNLKHFWGSKMTLSWTFTIENPIPQPACLVQMLGRKHFDLINAH